MTSLDQLKQTFFDECSELVLQIENGLTDLREGNETEDAINSVFRGVHSVKGGAGIFGFEGLVEFAHVFETVLDAMRHGTLAASPDAIDVLLTASDVLSDLVSMSRVGDAIPPEYGRECREQLERLIGHDGSEGGEDEAAPADFEGIDFVPVRVSDYDDVPEPGDGLHTFEIRFRPGPEMLQNANEPLLLVRELQQLGELTLAADIEGLPALDELVPDRPYIGWAGTLTTSATRDRILDVFEFVIGECELEVVEVARQGQQDLPEAAPALEPAIMDAQPEPQQAADEETKGAGLPGPQAAKPLEPAAEGRTPPAKPAATTTRVELEKIDRVVNMVGELVISQAMLGQIVQGLPEEVSGRLAQILDEVVHHTRELKDGVMAMRAQSVGAVFQRMPRLVRELGAKTAKKIRLEMVGEGTEVDRSIIERLADPLTHIIRNSVDHGIEAPPERLVNGKPEEGTIRLSAEHRGGRIIIEVRDDGAGINTERVLKKARERGLVSADASLTDDEISNLIFLPGFSTAETVSDISGRGVGMDVVRRNIQDIGGRISLKSERGRGMTIQLALPLTLAVMDGMVIKVGHETYVMPMSAIVECLRPTSADMHDLVGTHGMLRLRGDLVPLIPLGELLNVAPVANSSAERVVIITDAGEGPRFGVVVDELLGHQQVVIKSIEESYGSVPGIAGATILGNGRVAFILDVEKLSDLALSEVPSVASAHPAAKALSRAVA